MSSLAGANLTNVNLGITDQIRMIVETLNNYSPLRQRIKSEPWAGALREGRVHTRRSGALGFTEDGGALPVPKAQQYSAFKIYRKFLAGSVQISDGALAAINKAGSYGPAVTESELKNLMLEFMKLENFFGFRDGTGVCAQFKVDPSAVAAGSDLFVDDSRLLWEGVAYDIYDNANLTTAPVLNAGITIATVESAPGTSGAQTGLAVITADANMPAGLAGGASGDYIVWSGSVNRAINGLDSLVDDAAVTFQNIDVATNQRYAALVMSNSGTARPLTPNLFRQMVAGLFQKSGNQNAGRGLNVLGSSWQGVNLEELYEGELRVEPGVSSVGLPVKQFETAFGPLRLELDPDCPYGKMFFVDFSQIRRAVQQDVHWRPNGSAGLWQRSDAALVNTASLCAIFELMIYERHTSGKIEDLEEARSTMY